MSENTKIWDALAKTNPSQTKGFQRAGGFKGTAVKPIYCDQKMTEQFGPCGEGWGINEPSFQVVSTEKEILVYCTVSIWHGKRENVVFGVGGDKVVAQQSAGAKTNDEAFKMAFTDAIGNAYKHIGMSADIHMGLFDDNKYVADLKSEFSGPNDAGTGCITDEQRQHIAGLIDASGSDIIKFCKFYNISALPKLPAAKYDDAVKLLEAKAKKSA